MEGADLPIPTIPSPTPPSSLISAYWIIPGACFGLSAVTALFMKYRDHMLKVKSNAENLETWTDANEIEEMKAEIQERGKLCSLLRQELEQALQQEEQSVEELQWLVRDIERQKELEKEALSQRNADDKYKDKLVILKKELAWWKERARNLRDGSMSVAETEALKTNAERALVEKERELMKKKRALHELRRKRWEKPFRAIMPSDIDSVSTEYSTALKYLNSNSEESVKSVNSSTAIDTHAQRSSSSIQIRRPREMAQGTGSASVHGSVSEKDIDGLPRKASGSSIIAGNPTPAILAAGKAGITGKESRGGRATLSPIKKVVIQDEQSWKSVINLGPTKGIKRKPSSSIDLGKVNFTSPTSTDSDDGGAATVLKDEPKKKYSDVVGKQAAVSLDEMRNPLGSNLRQTVGGQSSKKLSGMMPRGSKDMALRSKTSTWQLIRLHMESGSFQRSGRSRSRAVSLKRRIVTKNVPYPAHWAAIKKRSLQTASSASEPTRISRSETYCESPDAVTAKDVSSADSSPQSWTSEVKSEDEPGEADEDGSKDPPSNKDVEESSTHASSPMISVSENENTTPKDSAFHSGGKSAMQEATVNAAAGEDTVSSSCVQGVMKGSQHGSDFQDKSPEQENPKGNPGLNDEAEGSDGLSSTETKASDRELKDAESNSQRIPTPKASDELSNSESSSKIKNSSCASDFILKTDHETVLKKSTSKTPFSGGQKESRTKAIDDPELPAFKESQDKIAASAKDTAETKTIDTARSSQKLSSRRTTGSLKLKASDIVVAYLQGQKAASNVAFNGNESMKSNADEEGLPRNVFLGISSKSAPTVTKMESQEKYCQGPVCIVAHHAKTSGNISQKAIGQRIPDLQGNTAQNGQVRKKKIQKTASINKHSAILVPSSMRVQDSNGEGSLGYFRRESKGKSPEGTSVGKADDANEPAKMSASSGPSNIENADDAILKTESSDDLLMLAKRKSSGAFDPESASGTKTSKTRREDEKTSTDEATTLFRNDSSKLVSSATTPNKPTNNVPHEGSLDASVPENEGDITSVTSILSVSNAPSSTAQQAVEEDEAETRLETSAFSTCSSSGSSDSIQLIVQ